MDYTARYGLEFNPFLKNSKEVFVDTQEQKETLYRLDYLLPQKALVSLPAVPEGARPLQ